MPALYAHKYFGETVLNALPQPLKNDIALHKEAFVLGTQGPDILFNHKPFSKNAIKQQGMDMHLRSAKDFFEKSAQKVAQAGNQSATSAYVAGFICHFMLDNACHPHIYLLESKGVSHGRIESEFDKYLKRKNGEKVHLPNDTIVSMNCWCFTPEFFEGAMEDFEKFINDPDREPMKSECLLPNTVFTMMQKGLCDVAVLPTTAKWFGVTYADDKPDVIAKLNALIAEGVYPDGLWK